MVDNTTLDAGTGGDVIASDDIAGIKYQRVKLVEGADGVNDGDISSANPLPVQISDGTEAANVNANNRLEVAAMEAGSVVDSNNSTTTPLGGAAAFTGTGTDLLGYSAVTCTLFADVDSATDGMTFQFSTDNSNWDDIYTFTMDVSASTMRRFQFPICARYFRIVYTNGAGAQAAFRVQTILHTANQLTSIHRIVDEVSPDRSAQVVKAALIAQRAGTGDFIPVSATASNNLRVAIKEMDASLPAGTNAIGKLAANSGVDIGDVDVTSLPTDTFAADAQPYGKGVLVQGDDGTDRRAVLVDTDGHLQVDILSGAGSGGTSMVDDAAFTPGVTSITPVGAMFDDVAPDSVDEGDAGVVRMSANRNLYTTIRDAAGNERGANVDGAGALEVSDDTVRSSTASIDSATTAIATEYVAEGGALGKGVLVQGDDGTVRKNINVDATTGDVQVDVTNTVTVDGSGVTQPVSGTVTETNSAAILADTASIDTNAATIAGAVAAGQMQVDVVAALPAGTNAIGKVKVSDGVEDAAVNTNNRLEVATMEAGSVVDANNSTTTPLGGSATFTGTGTDLLGYSAVTCTLYADVDSATDGMTFQFSTDNTNWDDVYTFTKDVSDSDTRRFQFPICARYFRIVYTNGAGAQAAFRAQTILHTANQLTSVHRISEDVSPDRSAQIVTAVLSAQRSGSGDFIPISATGSGNLRVAVEEIDAPLDIASQPADTFVAEDGALGKGVLCQGDDGTDRHNLACDTSGRLQVDIAEQSDASPLTTQGAAAEDAAVSGNPVLTGGRYDTTARVLETGDVGAVAIGVDGALHTSQLPPALVSGPTHVRINENTAVTNELVAAQGAGNKIRILSLAINAHGNVSLDFRSGSTTVLSGVWEFDGTSQPKGLALQHSPDGHMVTAANEAFNMNQDATTIVAGHLVYCVTK